MTQLHEVIIREADVSTREDLHETLAEGLGFPAHYGANLNALDDCLGDISSPVLVRVVRERGEGLPLAGYVDKACLCLLRAARENPALDVEISFAEGSRSWRDAFAEPGDEELGLD